jgi:hypothetical protein
MLLETMESQFCFVVHKNFEGLTRDKVYQERIQSTTLHSTYIRHEFFACCPNLLGESGAKHHDLLVVWSRPEYFLNIAAHV